MSNLINSESGSTSKEDGYNYKVAEYVEDARQMGLTVLPPCVRRSKSMCVLECTRDDILNDRIRTIRFGLTLIKKVSNGAVDWIMKGARNATSLKDFVLRCYSVEQDDGEKKEWKVFTQIGKTDLEALALAGAFDIFDRDRDRVLAMLPGLQKLAKKFHDQTVKIKNGKGVRDKPARRAWRLVPQPESRRLGRSPRLAVQFTK